MKALEAEGKAGMASDIYRHDPQHRDAEKCAVPPALIDEVHTETLMEVVINMSSRTSHVHSDACMYQRTAPSNVSRRQLN